MALDGIILDIDGTLVDTNRLHARAWSRAMKQFGYGLDEDRIIIEIGKSGSSLVPSVLGDRVERERGEALRDAHDEIFLDLLDREPVRVFRGAEAIFERAREAGIQTAVATGSARESLEKMMDRAQLDIFDLAGAVVTDDDVDEGKPSPDPVESAVAKLELSPAQCVLIGDTPYDVLGAHRAGVLCLGVLTGVHPAEKMYADGAREVYEDVGEIADQFQDALNVSSPGPLHLTDEVARDLMAEALREARRGLEHGDLPVGSVLADGEGSIVARAYSTTETSGDFLAHAEVRVFQEISGRYPLNRRDLILVSTLEPCMMCLGAAMSARVDTIIYALPAPSNGGIARCRPMRSPGMIMPRVVGGVCDRESVELFAEWDRLHPGMPFVTDLLLKTSPSNDAC